MSETQDLTLEANSTQDLSLTATNGGASKSYVDGKVLAESEERQIADNEIKTLVIEEATARQSADNQLQTNIDALDANTSALVGSEATERKSADTDLSNKIADATSACSIALQTEETMIVQIIVNVD